jgi:predicted nucleic acid-binding protein
MPDIVIADTSCFIVLQKLHLIDLLKSLYGKILTTHEVAVEYGEPLPPWVVIASPTNKTQLQNLTQRVDRGEASALALALETPGCTLILDALKARKLAEMLGVNFTGTLGLIVKAKRAGLVTSVRSITQQMRSAGIRISEKVLSDIHKQAGE